jgi:hypothetical protein
MQHWGVEQFFWHHLHLCILGRARLAFMYRSTLKPFHHVLVEIAPDMPVFSRSNDLPPSLFLAPHLSTSSFLPLTPPPLCFFYTLSPHLSLSLSLSLCLSICKQHTECRLLTFLALCSL